MKELEFVTKFSVNLWLLFIISPRPAFIWFVTKPTERQIRKAKKLSKGQSTWL